ncbi:zinc-binding dehydrogenase [Hydrogenophaga sp. PAMC20947]|uniref:zinc-binding dehydrogenase n=1 Tax=Hydrogenophaga sp. PAMC20947 TaxID=2565558 RepID=UPI00109E0814|nr:zinc-binding dehydrogenase [Hydrogenophaga sp. PAMC20947]QCB47224.1 NADH oxidase [Hydrogenophaga sp. PAMC20947]
MTEKYPTSGLQLRTLVKPEGSLELSLVEVPTQAPGPDEVVVQIQAAPINPSDIGLLFGAADMSTAKASGTPERPVVTANIPERLMPAMAARLGQSLPAGNEAAGVVVAAGSSPAAQALLGKMVAVLGGEMYAQYRTIAVNQCLPLPQDATAAEGASCFVNPLTALGMTETMRREGHKALVHTVGASNLGQMLNRICIQDGIGLVNIVRKPEQAALLREQGATHICDSSSPTFIADLTTAIEQTGATLAFDAIGGGKLAGQILNCMEVAISRGAKEYNRYGSYVLKQVYVYGGLDLSPTEITRSFGMTWGIGGWLLFPFLQKIGEAEVAKLRARVASELKTTFASHYSHQISLAQALDVDVISAYAQRATGAKYLITLNQATQ